MDNHSDWEEFEAWEEDREDAHDHEDAADSGKVEIELQQSNNTQKTLDNERNQPNATAATSPVVPTLPPPASSTAPNPRSSISISRPGSTAPNTNATNANSVTPNTPDYFQDMSIQYQEAPRLAVKKPTAAVPSTNTT